jgi:glycosyltransferase involved in cell wall biosynthesis
MKVLIAHNSYQRPGGEDVVVQQEARMLEAAGHTIIRLQRSNAELERLGAVKKALIPLASIWSFDSYRRMRRLIEDHQPEVVHIHNTHMMLSPSILHACAEAGVPTVCTIHNWRRLCPCSTQFHRGCGPVKPLRCVLDGGYRGSVPATAAVALSTSLHEALGTWRFVHHIAISRFVKRRFETTLTAPIHVKPHFVSPDPGFSTQDGGYALFAGSLSEEKGVATLLQAWSMLKKPIPLLMAGSGPMQATVEAWARNHGIRSGLHLPLGQIGRNHLLQLMRGATFLVIPSQWDEPFGMVAIEALACGVPVIASDAGALPEIIQDGVSGMIFSKKDPAELAEKAALLWSDRRLRRRLSEGARGSYLLHYTEEKNYSQLMSIYRSAGASPWLEPRQLVVNA